MIRNAFVLLVPVLAFTSCANVSVRNYKPEQLKENERTIVGTFEVLNEAYEPTKPMPECKLTFLMPDGETTRRYFQQKEDKGIVVTWAEAGTVKLQSVDCGDSSFGAKLVDQNWSFKVDPKSKATYFGHVRVTGRFTGMSDAGGAIALGAVGMALAAGSRTNELKKVEIEDRWKTTQPVFAELVPALAKEKVTKSLAKR